MKPLKGFVKVGFKDYGTKTGGCHTSASYALLHAVEGEYPNQYVNPEMIMVSGGELEFPTTCDMFLDTDLKLSLAWDSSICTDANAYDQAMLLAYCPENNSVVSKVTGAFRMDGTDFLQLSLTEKLRSFMFIWALWRRKGRARPIAGIWGK